jgi:ABC-type lipoprotein export system ATPase subunit
MIGDADTPLVEFAELGRTFGHGPAVVVAVHGASGRVDRGDRVAIVGVSGSGKSTLLHLLAGIDVPTRGTVTWPAIGDRGALRPAHVAVVFQAPSLLDALTVVDNVSLPLLLDGTDPAAAEASAAEALGRLGLGDVADRLPEELSGGQAQRVAVARALATRPALLLADEPTGQLDHATAAVVMDALLDTAAVTGAGLVVSTHDRAVADRLTRRWIMADGRLYVPAGVG